MSDHHSPSDLEPTSTDPYVIEYYGFAATSGDTVTDLRGTPTAAPPRSADPVGPRIRARRRTILAAGALALALIAGGVGITPMRALFETIPLAPEQDLVLLYRARTREELVFRDLLSSSSLSRLVPNLVERDV